jgi:hypothetical protein
MNLIHFKWSRTVWPVAVAAAVAAGALAGAGNAAPSANADRGSYPNAKFKAPKLKRGVLMIEGTKASDKIALRLQAGDVGILQVDVGDDGSADFNFQRDHVAQIAVYARPGADTVRIDESNGAFTDSIETRIDGGNGNDMIAGGKGIEKLLGGAGNDAIDGNGGNDLALLGAGNDTFVWDPGDGSDVLEGQRRQRRRASRPVGERQPAQVLPDPGQHHDGHGRRGADRLQRPRRR